MAKKSFSWIDFVPVTIVSILFISQIIVCIYLLFYVSQIKILAHIGVGLYVFSGIVFGMLPIMEFRKGGGVKKGSSYIYNQNCRHWNILYCSSSTIFGFHAVCLCTGSNVSTLAKHILRRCRICLVLQGRAERRADEC